MSKINKSIGLESKLFRIVLPICVCLLTSCTTNYRFIPPTSESGKLCISKCEIQSTKCKKDISNSDSGCKEQAKQDYDSCSSSGNPADNKGDNPTRCNQRYLQNLCTPISYLSCSEDYRNCYQQCGGKEEEIK